MAMTEGKYLYQDFNAIVAPGYRVLMGTAVDFVPRTDFSNPIPLIKPAQPDTDDLGGAPRTTYVGVAMQAGDAGDFITVRYWGAGTMPALVFDTHGHNAGGHFFWDGHAFVHDLLSAGSFTTYSVEEAPGNRVGLLPDPDPSWTPDQWNGKVVKITSGYHQYEYYTIGDTVSFAVEIDVPDIHDHWFPADGGSDIITFEIYDDSAEDILRATAINMSQFSGALEPQIIEMLVLKGGRV